MPSLKDLIVDGGQVDESVLADVLMAYVRFDRESATVRFLPEWNARSARLKVLIYLLGRKAAALAIGKDGYEETQGPGQISEGTGIDGNTVRPTLSGLLKDGLVAKDARKRYFVPGHVLTAVRDLLAREKQNH